VAAGPDALRLLDTAWDELLLAQAKPDPTLTGGWLRHLAAAGVGEPLVVRVEAGSRLVACGALEVRRELAGRRVGMWLGFGPLVFGPDILVDPRRPWAAEPAARALLEAVDALVLYPVPADGPLVRALARLAPWGDVSSLGVSFESPLPPPRLGDMARKVAYELRRGRRRGSVEVAVRQEPEELAEALERLFELHAERWAGRPDAIPRFGASEAQRAWYRDALGDFARHGRVRIVEVVEGGRVVASVLGLLAGRGALFHTSATRAGSAIRRPGHVAMLAWADEAVASGATWLRLGGTGGNPEGPKRALGAEPYERVRVVVAGRRIGQPVLRTVRALRRRRRVEPPALIRSADPTRRSGMDEAVDSARERGEPGYEAPAVTPLGSLDDVTLGVFISVKDDAVSR
jgi:hypothetical protein